LACLYGSVQSNLVQLLKFWTSNTPIFAKWQHLEQGHFDPFQVLQHSYIVLDLSYLMGLVSTVVEPWFTNKKNNYSSMMVICILIYSLTRVGYVFLI
jgi:hypothetical protein